MAERRMFSKTITSSARFLMMPASARLLYYDLGMLADDDGIVEAFVVMRLSGASEADLSVLESKGYITVLNDELVSYICDWKRNNHIKKDRYQPSVYKDLLPVSDDTEPSGSEEEPQESKAGTQTEPKWIQSGSNLEPKWNQSGSNLEPEWNQSGSNSEPQVRLGKDRLGKESIGKDRSGEGRIGSSAPQNAPHTLTPEERDALISEGISGRYIDERVERAEDYALSRKRRASSVIREWWASDKDSYRAPSESSFDTDDFFEAAVMRSMRELGADIDANTLRSTA